LFVAVLPPLEVVGALAEAVRPLRAGAPGLRWVPPERWHVTLAFLGEVPDRGQEELRTRLARAALRHPPLALRVGAGGRFTDRVLYAAVSVAAVSVAGVSGAGVSGEPVALRRLAESVCAAARRCGIAVDGRRFRPHLTLARSPGGTDLRPLAGLLEQHRGPVWAADRVRLMRSALPTGPGRGPEYTEVAGWPLGRESTATGEHPTG
jgi:2'-5' RNA ligase